MNKHILQYITMSGGFGAIAVCGVLYAALIQAPTLKAMVRPSPIVESDALYVTDFSDDQKLVGFSPNVFVGKVLSQSGVEPLRGKVPATQFSVDAILNIKGFLQGPIRLSQVGAGYENGVLHLDEGETGLLQVGATYLFSTTYDDVQDWWEISGPPYDRILISTDNTLTDAQLVNIARSNKRFMALQAAYPDEILFKGTPHWNSYQSRHYDTDGQLVDDTLKLHNMLSLTKASGNDVTTESESPSPSPSDPVASPVESIPPAAEPVSPSPSDAVASPVESIPPAAESTAPTPESTDQPAQS